jgi:hypothetical protein
MLFASVLFVSGCGSSATFTAMEGVKAGPYDTGKMWAFEFLPPDYLPKAYNFNPPSEWFLKARLSAVRLQNCSGSFVSEDGLIMTNHHCARGAIDRVAKPDEKLHETGFYAQTLEEERKIPNAYVDQLVLIEDVTNEVQDAFDTGTTDDEKVSNRQAKIQEIEKRKSSETKLRCSVVTFFNGGRYSLYGYKRYNDVRLVFAVETDIGFYGGDPDNFTYPRYDLDCAFYRIYQDGKPLRTENFFKWSPSGAQEGEATFVIGNPGRTTRLATFAQLEYYRDYPYPTTLTLLDNMVSVYQKYVDNHPDQLGKYQNTIFGFANSQKSYKGRLEGLRDKYLMSKKYDFEQNFKAAVLAKPELKSKYAGLWNEIAKLQKERAAIFPELNAYNVKGLSRSVLFGVAVDLVELAHQMQLPDSARLTAYRGSDLDSMKTKLFTAEYNPEIDGMILVNQLKFMKNLLGTKNDAFNKLLGGLDCEKAAVELISKTNLKDKAKVAEIGSRNAEAILMLDDPFVQFVVATEAKLKELREISKTIGSKEAAKVQQLGKAVYEVYGTSIPPDATFTLRLADGVVKSYEYNGTIAPPITTFYGMYDRHFSFGKKYPWSLPERWQNPPAELLPTPMNFIISADIIGGNSGSPVLNKNLEVVGLVFDGNIESLPGDFIFDDTKNRTVAVHSEAIPAAMKLIYKADRIAKELRAGKIVQ